MRHSTLLRNSSPSRQRHFDLRLPAGPRRATLNRILDYSKALVVVDAPPLGKVDIVLN